MNRIALLIAFFGLTCFAGSIKAQSVGFQKTTADVQPKIVKINGSGGFRGLESYQSGFLISPEGHILTVWSYVLDSDIVTATLNDGQKFEAKLIGYDRQLEVAILKIESSDLPAFNIDAAAKATAGSKVLAFSNLYGVATGNEAASVLFGIVSAKANLETRRGASESNYKGPVYVLDAMTNNPGAAGGAVTNLGGELVGMIGKELRDAQTNAWLNFAIPMEELAESILEIRSGKMIVQRQATNSLPAEPYRLDVLGVSLVPDIVAKTPPFVDRVAPDSLARRAGISPDDLIVELNGIMTQSNRDVIDRLKAIDRDSILTITIQRDKEFLSVEIDPSK